MVIPFVSGIENSFSETIQGLLALYFISEI